MEEGTKIVNSDAESNRLTDLEMEQIRSILQIFPIHNHDGRNSLDVATKKVRASVVSQRVVSPTDIVAGETIANGNALRVSSTTDFIILSKEGTAAGDSSSINDVGQKLSQSFTLSDFDSTTGSGKGITSLKIYLKDGAGTANSTLRVSIFNDSSGSPGATEHAFEEKIVELTTSYVEHTFTFTGFMPTSGTTYWLVLHQKSTRTIYVQRTGSDDYTNKKVNPSGAAWAADSDSNDWNFKIFFQEASEKRVFKASSLSSNMDELFVGIASMDATVGQTMEYISIGTKVDFESLTTGAKYYLTDTAGTIGTTPGRFTVPIGKAISSEILYIQPPPL